MHATQFLITLIPIAYLIGSIPFGLIVGRAKGIDVRTSGSGNIGATNVGRLLGKKYFFLVFFLDLLKSFMPMAIASYVVTHSAIAFEWTTYLLWLLVGFAAVIGHMFSVFLKFTGGKGVATSAGVVLGLIPYFIVPGAISIGVFVVVFYVTRYVSLGSIVSACVFPILFIALGLWRGWPVFGQQLPLTIFAVLIALMIVVKHRTNISRLLAGTENRVVTRRPVE